MIYHVIKQFEKQFAWQGFNRKSLSQDDLLIWLKNLGVISLPDKKIPEAILLKYKEKPLLFYNPYLHPDKLIITLGHELGHILLGHTDHVKILFSKYSYFSKSGLEKDAGIIGFLCWLPTPFLRKLETQERLSIPELAWELSTCDTEWELMYKLCDARMRIYNAWKRIENTCSQKEEKCLKRNGFYLSF